MHQQPLSPAERRLFNGLLRRRTRQESGLFLAEGVRVAEELIAAGIVPRIAAVSSTLGDTSRGERLHHALAARCEVRVVAEHELARLADTETPQGVLVAAEMPSTAVRDWAVPRHALVLGLDAVQDPGNFGTLARSALAFGATAVLALPGTVDAWNPKAVRAAAGATFHLPVGALDTDAALDWLRAHDFALYVADMDGTPLPAVRPAPRAALVVGNEGAGVSAAVRNAATARVAIPMRGPAESLNVAVAAGIILYHLAEHRSA
jgi:RNA methyltransferase, TrmH family